MNPKAGTILDLEAPDGTAIEVAVDSLVIGGWTGRDPNALRHHIEELAAIGIAGPSQIPTFYRCAADAVTTDDAIQVLGEDSSGEVETVLISDGADLWVTVGSDHTDRKVEAYSIAVSKQLCRKPVASQCWRFSDVEAHWDKLQLKAWATIDGERVLYQEGTLTAVRSPRDILAARGGSALPAGTVLFMGTLPAIGGIRAGSRFEMELTDPVLNRVISHAYDIETLPVVS